MREPLVVITVAGGIAEVYSNESGSEVVILDYDGLNEHGTKTDRERAEKMLREERYEELSLFLHEIG